VATVAMRHGRQATKTDRRVERPIRCGYIVGLFIQAKRGFYTLHTALSMGLGRLSQPFPGWKDASEPHLWGVARRIIAGPPAECSGPDHLHRTCCDTPIAALTAGNRHCLTLLQISEVK
jgi:hypothetical protein